MMTIKYVGDLSKMDATVLAAHVEDGFKVLEFGSGGSTQIFAQCNPSRLVSLETDSKWIERTRQNCQTLGVEDKVEFYDHGPIPTDDYDVIFVDGIWHERSNFMKNAWPMLKIGGVMIVHDTRRDFDIDNVLRFMADHFEQISQVHINAIQSNCTVIVKREPLPYENWNEGMLKWQYGDGEPGPLEEWLEV